jgi:hypothetical protein
VGQKVGIQDTGSSTFVRERHTQRLRDIGEEAERDRNKEKARKGTRGRENER